MNDVADDASGKVNIYTYSLKDSTITLKAITDTHNNLTGRGNRATYLNGGTINFDESEGTATLNSAEYVINDSTYFFVKDTNETGDDRYAVIKASELKEDVNSTAEAPVAVAQKINGFDTLLVGYISDSKLVTTEAEDYYFVTGSPKNMGENEDGDYTIELPVNAAGTDSTLTFKYSDESSSKGDMASLNALVGKLINVDLESDGSVADSTSVTVIEANEYNSDLANDQWIIGDLSAWSSTRATIGGNNFKVAEDVKIFNVDVDSDGDATFEGEGSAVKAEAIYDEDGTTVTGYYDNAVFVRNTDGEISAIFTEIDGTAISAIVAE